MTRAVQLRTGRFFNSLNLLYPMADMDDAWWLGSGLIEVRPTETDGLVQLVGFWVAPNRRNEGHGSSMLDTLCGLADRSEINIVTWAEPYCADREKKKNLMKKEALMKWYSRWNFSKPLTGDHKGLLIRTSRG